MASSTFRFGDIVLVRFPFTNQSASKQRPAVVVASDAYIIARPDLLIMPITSQLRPTALFGEVYLRDWESARLLKPSAIKPVLTTIEQSMVIRRLGSLSADDREALHKTIPALFG